MIRRSFFGKLFANRTSQGFTLIELLVVIAILAVLAVVVVLTLNPAGLLQEARDANRLQDMASLSNAIGYSLADNSGESLGQTSVVYVSVPDPTATSTAGDQCQGLGLPFLPSGWSYQCASSSTFKFANGTGWVPVNFTQNSFGSSLPILPVDPINSTSSRFYYTYTMSGSRYEVTTNMEAARDKLGGSSDKVSTDGGLLMSLYEKGTQLGLEPLDYGDASLVGYWTFDEGTTSIAYDYAGQNATDSWMGGAVGTSGYYSAGKVGAFAGAFDGSSTYVANNGNNAAFKLMTGMTLVAWIKMSASGVDQKVISKRPSYVLTVYTNNIPETEIFIASTSYDTRSAAGGTVLANGVWYQVAGTYDGATLKTYVNGALDRQISAPGTMDNTSYVLNVGKTADGTANYFNGLIDDPRVYNRALSAAEIAALYAAQK